LELFGFSYVLRDKGQLSTIDIMNLGLESPTVSSKRFKVTRTLEK